MQISQLLCSTFLVASLNPWCDVTSHLRAQEPVAKVPFAIADFLGLESECLSALEAPEKIPALLTRIESKFEKDAQPEAIRMLAAILRGSDMGMGSGWFGFPKQKRDWNWLAAEHKLDADDRLTKDDFRGDPMFFERLDRNGDGELKKDDFSWSPDSPFMREQGVANSIFRTMDKGRDAKLSKEELLAFFDKARGDNTELGIDTFRRSFGLGNSTGLYFPGDAPTPDRLIRGFFSSELGSLQEGPGLGDVAPDFELTTQDGSQTIRLKDYLGKKPVVLVFGNFTCGPFRRTYPDFDEIGQRYKDRATFLGVYVREAHPDDGWHMESNVMSGVKLRQPTNFEERTAVARTCAAKLKYSMPLLVDTMDDQVGNLYSGMPARAYVIDVDGKVTYQGARGPFGFRPGEMEQALIMTLMD